MNDDNGLIPAIDYFTLSKTGLTVKGEPPFDQWQRMLNYLEMVEESVQWWLGDLICYGEARWGEMYAQAIKETGFKYGTLRNAKWVAARFELSLRNDNLSWHHHRIVAPLDNADALALLQQADEECWSVSELRQHVISKQNENPALFDLDAEREYIASWLLDRRGTWPDGDRRRFWETIAMIAKQEGEAPKADMAAFARFWANYPRHTDKQKAVQAWKRLAPSAELVETILAAIQKQKHSDQWRRGIVPHPATWLNGRRWEDEMPAAAAPNGRHTETTAERIARLTGKNP